MPRFFFSENQTDNFHKKSKYPSNNIIQKIIYIK